MYLLLILPILVSGFLCCNLDVKAKQKLYRYEGQSLYLLAATYGVFCFILGVVLLLILNKLPTEIKILCHTIISLDIIGSIKSALTTINIVEDKNLNKVSWLICLALTTLFSSLIWSVLIYIYWCAIFRTTDPKTPIAGTILGDSPLDKILFHASKEKGDTFNLMISLEDRKVYVGRVVSLAEPNETSGHNQEIAIVPILSGYRDSNTLEVCFTTDYDDADDKDLLIVIRQCDIISVTKFSLESYMSLNPEKQEWHPVNET